jgi:hypothetical protein
VPSLLHRCVLARLALTAPAGNFKLRSPRLRPSVWERYFTRCTVGSPAILRRNAGTLALRSTDRHPDVVVMLFTGYTRESDHGPAPDMVMPTMLSTAGRWVPARRSFDAFHGEFAGWSEMRLFSARNLYVDTGRMWRRNQLAVSLRARRVRSPENRCGRGRLRSAHGRG